MFMYIKHYIGFLSVFFLRLLSCFLLYALNIELSVACIVLVLFVILILIPF